MQHPLEEGFWPTMDFLFSVELGKLVTVGGTGIKGRGNGGEGGLYNVALNRSLVKNSRFMYLYQLPTCLFPSSTGLSSFFDVDH